MTKDEIADLFIRELHAQGYQTDSQSEADARTRFLAALDADLDTTKGDFGGCNPDFDEDADLACWTPKYMTYAVGNAGGFSPEADVLDRDWPVCSIVIRDIEQDLTLDSE